MRMSPEDAALRRVLRTLAEENIGDRHEKVLFLDPELHPVEVVYHPEIQSGSHLEIRDRLMNQEKLRGIMHHGLLRLGEPQCYVHVVDKSAPTMTQQIHHLWTLRQKNDHVFWVPTSVDAQNAWRRRWFPDQ